jgi:hypothetical protein
VYVLAVPLAIEAFDGNVNALLLAGVSLTWVLYYRGRIAQAAALAAGLAVLKVTPVFVIVWTIAVGGRRAWAGASVGGGVALAISLLGAGINATVAYTNVVLHTETTGASDFSLAGMARTFGAPDAMGAALLAAVAITGMTVIVVSRRDSSRSFQAAVATLVLASPVVFLSTLCLLLPIAAPSRWRVREGAA